MGARTPSQSYQWSNWLNLILAVWLFISPWVLGFAYAPAATPAGAAPPPMPYTPYAYGGGIAAWDAWVVAVIVGVLSIAAISRLAVWEEWVNLVLGVWLFFSPWILGYAALYGAVWNSLVVGFLFAVLAIWGIAAARRVGTRVQTDPRSGL
jgi:hypothetical protein